jgi:hypothetical protein
MILKIEGKKDFYFFRNMFLIVFFLTLTPITILASLYSLYSLSKQPLKTSDNTPNVLLVPKSGVKVFASLPNTYPNISTSIETADARIMLLKKYLVEHNSPLAGHEQVLVEEADNNNLDYRLVTAISQQESNLCKKIPQGSYNCWGWGIHSAGTLGFSSYEEGIKIVSRGLKDRYVGAGFETIDEIMSKYTPSSKGSWAFGVNKFMSDIETLNY